MKNNHDEKFDSRKVKLINFISLLLGFSSALAAYVISSYFKEVSGWDNISVFYIAAYVIALIFLLNLHKLVRKFGKSLIFFACLLMLAGSAFLIFLFPPSWFSAVILIVNIIFYSLCATEKDIILESYSKDKLSGRIRGLNLTLVNLGFIFGPFVSTQILEKYGFQGIFLAQSIVLSLMFILAFKGLKNINHRFKPIITVNKLFKKALKRKNVMRVYYMSFILDFFFFIMVAYTPIYLRNLGMPWETIGIIFSFMLIPFVLLEYPAGSLADKKLGEKEMLILALFIISLSTFWLYFIDSANPYIWGISLFVTRIGASLLEVMRDSYFYKRIDGHDVDIINFFRTSSPTGYILGAILSGILLLFFPLKSVFILAALLAFSGLYPAFKLADNKSEAEI